MGMFDQPTMQMGQPGPSAFMGPPTMNPQALALLQLIQSRSNPSMMGGGGLPQLPPTLGNTQPPPGPGAGMAGAGMGMGGPVAMANQQLSPQMLQALMQRLGAMQQPGMMGQPGMPPQMPGGPGFFGR